jgi:hypothetical protein
MRKQTPRHANSERVGRRSRWHQGSFGARVKQLGDQARPAGLMRGSEATASVAMKVLVKKNVVAKVWIMLEPVIVTARGASALRVDEEQSRQAAFQLDGHVVDGHVVT